MMPVFQAPKAFAARLERLVRLALQEHPAILVSLATSANRVPLVLLALLARRESPV